MINWTKIIDETQMKENQNQKTNRNDSPDNHASENGMVTRMFRDRETTERAYNSLKERGYEKDDINLIMSEDTRNRHFSDDAEKTKVGTKAAEGAVKGSAVGGTLGAIAGAIAGIGTSLVIPGLGLVIAGPIAVGLVGAGAGVITGGFIGALVGWGIPEARAKLYESGIEGGNIVIGVIPRDEEDAKYLENEWLSNNGQETHK